MRLLKLSILAVFFSLNYTNAKCQRHHTSDKNVYLMQMDTMMQNMDTVSMGGSADIDFIAMMIPHHEGAIDMANYEIQHGKDFNMIQLAKSIITDQANEITQMQLWLHNNNAARLKFTGNSSYDEPLMQTMAVMMKNMPAANSLTNTDTAFAAVMLPHHQAAIDMAKVVLQYGKDKLVARMAQNIISSQEIEIEQMDSYLSKHTDTLNIFQ
jgi:uncharacterized protein (DUF305 family)